MSIVNNVKIYDLDECLVAAGYPMRTVAEQHPVTEQDKNRGLNLVKATKDGNTAHSQFLTGIRVNFDLTCSNKMWVEAERYRFLEFVSSQSTMHRITKFDLDQAYNGYVDKRIIEIMKEKVKEYNAFIEVREAAKGHPEIVAELNRILKEMYLEIHL